MEDAGARDAGDSSSSSTQRVVSVSFEATDEGGGGGSGALVATATTAPPLRKASIRSPKYFNLKTFTLLSCACLLPQIFAFSVQVSTITTVQKAFGLTTGNIGTWFAAYTAAEIVSGVLVPYFAGQSRTPRVLFVSLLVMGVACFAHSAPHFLFGTRGRADERSPLSTAASGDVVYGRDVCGWVADGGPAGGNGSLPSAVADSCSSESSVTYWTTVLYVVAGVIYGLSYAHVPVLPMAYMSDNAETKEEASLYQGLFYGVHYFGYVLGYLFAAGTLTFYVDLSDVNFSTDDPRWIGAWWVGYVICGGMNFLLAVPMFFFPPRLPKPVPPSSSTAELQPSGEKPDMLPPVGSYSTPAQDADVVNALEESDEDYSDELPSPKLFFPTLWSFVKNPIYVLAAFSMCLVTWIEAGFQSYLPKYLEIMYQQTAAAADLETGVIMSVASTLMVLSGGWIVSRFKLNIQQCIGLIVCTYAVGTALYLAGGFLSCPQYVADNDFKHDPSYNCTGELYSPVCINGLSYYSPCHAGCYNVTSDKEGNLKYEGCFCSLNATVNAYTGPCRDECNEVIPYVAIITLAYALPCLSNLAGLTVILRSVKKEQKGFSLGIYYEFLSLAASLPSPIVYGELIDRTCLVWDGDAEGCSDDGDSKGNCMQYANSDLRFVMHSLATSMQGVGCTLAIVTWLVVWVRERKRLRQPTSAVSPPALEDVTITDARDNPAFSLDSKDDVGSMTTAEPAAFSLSERYCPDPAGGPVHEHTQL